MCNCNSRLTKTPPLPVTLADVNKAAIRIEKYVKRSAFEVSDRFSEQYGHRVYLKREDQQTIRSFKLRGALNKLLSLSPMEKKQGVVCASAGNHAQGFAYSCHLLGIQGVVFLPQNTPKQKVEQVIYFGKEHLKVVIEGENFDQSCLQAQKFAKKKEKIFIHPFDDVDVIAGQGTLALEMIADFPRKLDALLVPVGGGGLASGVGIVYKNLSPSTRLIGVEVEGADAMSQSLNTNTRIKLDSLDTFADGTAVKQVGRLGFELCSSLLDDILLVNKKTLCEVMLSLNNQHGMVVEPSGALALAALDQLDGRSGQFNVGCVISGGNNDARRFTEVINCIEA